MDMSLITQIVGWLASLSAISCYCFKQVRHVRMVNCIAGFWFIIYGILLNAPAIAIMNGTLIIIHLCYLLSHDKFGDWVTKHSKIAIALFSAYTIGSIGWVCVNTNMNIAEIVGILSGVGFVGGFLLPSEKPMRSVCSLALIINIIYAIMIGSPQIIITNSISLAVNIWHLLPQSFKTMLIKKNSREEIKQN